ncbi:MAG: hypothetical protein DLM59_02315 [Pseudonocardiales bacterium]|nr:MAG: hypothetical protein DLM59_02315 [Pseudonocardiales bacterium]
MTDSSADPGAVAVAIAKHLPEGLRYRRPMAAASRPGPLLCRACRTPLAGHLAGLGVHLLCTDPTNT